MKERGWTPAIETENITLSCELNDILLSDNITLSCELNDILLSENGNKGKIKKETF